MATSDSITHSLDETVFSRFWSKVDKSSGENSCWNWTAGKVDGYGRIYAGGRLWLAHRLSYFFAHSKCPDSLCVLHSCDNPACVNPKHLSLGTKKDNAVDRDIKGRAADHSGENHGRHKVSQDDVAAIRHLHATEGLTYREIGRRFNISRQAVGHIIRGETWRTSDT